MSGVFGAIFFMAILFIFIAVAMYFILKKSSSSVRSSRYVINKFKPDNTAPKLTEMIEFHKNNKTLSKYSLK